MSRLTGIPVNDLHMRFRSRKKRGNRQIAPSPASSPTAATTIEGSPASSPKPAGPLSASGRAQRWILATLLAEPVLWHDVQMQVNVEDFEEGELRDLADFYWTYQRNEGEPLFNELLSLLPDETLKSLAVDLMEEFDSTSHQDAQVHRKKALTDSIDALRWERTQAERSHRQAALANGEDEIEQLNRLTELSRVASLRNKNY
ncbi:MAG: hypothetical protein JO353_12260 [Phycisphaerae bacterium]|nr:hypothetical protein [Phycisphaerae bacterium]